MGGNAGRRREGNWGCEKKTGKESKNKYHYPHSLIRLSPHPPCLTQYTTPFLFQTQNPLPCPHSPIRSFINHVLQDLTWSSSFVKTFIKLTIFGRERKPSLFPGISFTIKCVAFNPKAKLLSPNLNNFTPKLNHFPPNLNPLLQNLDQLSHCINQLPPYSNHLPKFF